MWCPLAGHSFRVQGVVPWLQAFACFLGRDSVGFRVEVFFGFSVVFFWIFGDFRVFRLFRGVPAFQGLGSRVRTVEAEPRTLTLNP